MAARWSEAALARASDEVAVDAEVPAAPSGPEPADTGGEAEDVGGVVLPDWATPITLDDMKLLIRECRRLMPEVGIQVPPNLVRLVGRAGA